MSDQTTDPTRAPLLTFSEQDYAMFKSAGCWEADADALFIELDAQRQRVASLTAENARLREERDAAVEAREYAAKSHAATVRALEAAAIQDTDAILRVADIIERELWICQGQWLRGVGHRLREAENKAESWKERAEHAEEIARSR